MAAGGVSKGKGKDLDEFLFEDDFFNPNFESDDERRTTLQDWSEEENEENSDSEESKLESKLEEAKAELADPAPATPQRSAGIPIGLFSYKPGNLSAASAPAYLPGYELSGTEMGSIDYSALVEQGINPLTAISASTRKNDEQLYSLPSKPKLKKNI